MITKELIENIAVIVFIIFILVIFIYAMNHGDND